MSQEPDDASMTMGTCDMLIIHYMLARLSGVYFVPSTECSG
jgi:hypothetical protein